MLDRVQVDSTRRKHSVENCPFFHDKVVFLRHAASSCPCVMSSFHQHVPQENAGLLSLYVRVFARFDAGLTLEFASADRGKEEVREKEGLER